MNDLTLSPDWILQHRFNLFPNEAYNPKKSKQECIAQLSKEIKSAHTLKLDITPSSGFLELQYANSQITKALRKEKKQEDVKKINRSQNKQSQQIRNKHINSYHKNISTYPNGFTSRINRFWSNHFCIEPKNQVTRACSASYPNEAIYPYIFGDFADLLTQAILHPAMLKYLDNEASIGPNSSVGKKRNLDINENLAREILELHTLGVNGGYQHKDIENLAYILSGWTIRKKPQAKTIFIKNKHEPGSFTILNQTFSPNQTNKGENQIHDALKFLANHSSTANFICKKLLAHFIPQSDPSFKKSHLKLVRSFQKSKGNLSSVYLELIKLDSLWSSAPSKYKQPDEWLYGIISNIPKFDDFKWIEKKCRELSKPTFAPESPAGWSEDNGTWMTAEALYRQKEIASEAAFRYRKLYQNNNLIKRVINNPMLASEHTQLALSQCKNKQQTFIVLAMCPENLFR